MNKNISVLMSIYINDKPEEVKLAIESILKQTLSPKELIIIVDGPINNKLSNLLKTYKKHPTINIIIHYIPKNIGLASALNIGTALCNCKYIARMDSDDYSTPNRLEKQINYLIQNNLDVVCALQEEFINNIDNIFALKITPESNSEIKKALTLRNVISHPSIIIKKDILVESEGYNENVGLQEDYDLHMKLIQKYKYGCIQEPLIKVRVSDEQRKRRGGLANLKNSIKLRFSWYKKGYLSLFKFLKGAILFSIFSMLPSNLKSVMYRFVRKPVQS